MRMDARALCIFVMATVLAGAAFAQSPTSVPRPAEHVAPAAEPTPPSAVVPASSAEVGPPVVTPPTPQPTQPLPLNLPELTKPSNIASTLQLVALLSVLSLAPAILLMVTSF